MARKAASTHQLPAVNEAQELVCSATQSAPTIHGMDSVYIVLNVVDPVLTRRDAWKIVLGSQGLSY